MILLAWANFTNQKQQTPNTLRSGRIKGLSTRPQAHDAPRRGEKLEGFG
jgi:hypothetical protein